MNLETEQLRFNDLTSERAKEILAAAEGQKADFRSCWYCNGAHEHLKNREVLLCFACGMYYLSGFPALVVVRRAKEEPITVETMKEFQEALNRRD